MSSIRSPSLPIIVEDLEFFPVVTADKPVLNKHHGQRKLFMTEMNFINKVIARVNKTGDNRPLLFVYAGAAPCSHLGYMATLFPKIKFLLVDPNEFFLIRDGKSHYENDLGVIYLKSSKTRTIRTNSKRTIKGHDGKLAQKGYSSTLKMDRIIQYIKESPAQIFIIEDYFTTELAQALKNDDYYMIFMSDIRTNVSVDDHDDPPEADVLWNNAQVFNWVSAMLPDAVCHKNRMQYINFPFGSIEPFMIKDLENAKNAGIDFVENFKENKFVFFSGETYFEPWISRGSSETRLIFFKDQSVSLGPLEPFGVLPGPKNVCEGKYFDYPDDYVPFEARVGSIGTLPYVFRSIDLFEYDQRMLFHNRANRAHGDFPECKSFGVDHCFECVYETIIWTEYCRLFGFPEEDGADFMATLSEKIALNGKEISLEFLHRKTRLTKTGKSFHVNIRTSDKKKNKSYSSDM